MCNLTHTGEDGAFCSPHADSVLSLSKAVAHTVHRFKTAINIVFLHNISIWNFLSIEKVVAFLYPSLCLYQMHCEKDRTCRSWRASVTQFSDALVHNTVYEQVPTMCSNAYFKLVSYSMVNSHFPSDLYWFCTSLSMHTHTQVESAKQAVSEFGIKYSLLSGPFYASKGWMQNCESCVNLHEFCIGGVFFL